MLIHRVDKSTFKHRFRLEQRFVQQAAQLPNSSFGVGDTDFKMRFRYRFTWGMPLFKIKENKNISITAFDEFFLNTNKGIVPRSINQNWFYAGLSYPDFKNASVGIGYMNAYAPKGNNAFASNHILQTTLKYHFK